MSTEELYTKVCCTVVNHVVKSSIQFRLSIDDIEYSNQFNFQHNYLFIVKCDSVILFLNSVIFKIKKLKSTEAASHSTVTYSADSKTSNILLL